MQRILYINISGKDDYRMISTAHASASHVSARGGKFETHRKQVVIIMGNAKQGKRKACTDVLIN